MRKSLLITILAMIAVTGNAQVTLLKANKGFNFKYLLLSGKTLMTSGVDSTLWITDATPDGTIQLSPTIKATDGAALLNGKYIFSGTTAETGEEIFISDGTVAGTHIIKDIIAGATGSAPADHFAVLNGFVYFTDSTAASGRELWRTDGTSEGTTMVKDIIQGTEGSNGADQYNLVSNGSFLLFSANTPATGVELYKSDGTEGGTNVLLDINPGLPSSDPDFFTPYNNMILFVAKTANEGAELWKTDGTPGGTSLVKDIREGTAGSFSLGLFYPFNGQMLFTANNGTNGDEIWITDGTNGNTRLLKDINPGTGGSSAFLILSVKVGNRLIFSASNASSQIGGGFEIPTNSELWETDGTEAGTHIFKEIVPGATGSSPVVLPAFDFSAGTFATALFQGNKFFFIATTPDKGAELWISDGSDAGTQMIKDINPNAKDGVTNSTYLYTTTAFYFSGDDGVHGSELWKSDGTADGTVMVADINPNADLQQTNSDVEFGMVLNNKIIFNANNGDNTADDLYRLEGTFSSLPLNLLDFTVISKNADANVAWTTLTEVNVKDFSVQRSDDGAHFVTIGTVGAAGNSTEKRGYRFTDVGIGNSNRDVVYYKLLINDKDSKSATSKIVSLRLKGAGEWAVKMVKNPVLSDINLLVTGVTEPVKVSVSDISGRAVNIKATVSGNGQITLSAANLVPGVYVLRAETSSDRKVIKFVKQ